MYLYRQSRALRKQGIWVEPQFLSCSVAWEDAQAQFLSSIGSVMGLTPLPPSTCSRSTTCSHHSARSSLRATTNGCSSTNPLLTRRRSDAHCAAVWSGACCACAVALRACPACVRCALRAQARARALTRSYAARAHAQFLSLLLNSPRGRPQFLPPIGKISAPVP